MKINCQSSLSWFHTEISEQKNYDPNLYDIFFDIQATSNFERHFIAELIIALKCLPKKDKALFSGTYIFTTPWIRPSAELLKDIACKNKVSESYVEQDAYFKMLSEHLSTVTISEKCISEVIKARTMNGRRHYGFAL